MCSLMFIIITAFHFAYLYVASDKFFVTKPDQEAESFSQMMEAVTFWNELKTNFNTKFSERRFNFRHQMEVEHCCPDYMNGIPNAQENAERATQKRQKNKGT